MSRSASRSARPPNIYFILPIGSGDATNEHVVERILIGKQLIYRHGCRERADSSNG